MINYLAMRLFIAVELDEGLRSKIEDLQKQIDEEALKLVEPENLHVTLKFIGEVPDEKAGEIAEKLKAVKMPPFEMKIGGIGVFPDMNYIRIVWVGLEGALAELAGKVENALEGLEYVKKSRYPFSGHLTIARVKRKPRYLAQKLQGLPAAGIGVQKVDRFFLIKSTLTPEGPVYERVAEFRLAA